MKIKKWDLIMIAFFLSLITIAISGYILGQGRYDFNWWIALLIYSIPAFILSALNGMFLIEIQKLVKKRYLRIGFGIIPSVILLGLLMTHIDFMEYVAIFGIIPILITFLIWISNFLTSDKYSNV